MFITGNAGTFQGKNITQLLRLRKLISQQESWLSHRNCATLPVFRTVFTHKKSPKVAQMSRHKCVFFSSVKLQLASEEVTLQLVKSKCIPVLLYGLEACPHNKSQLASLDFVINRFFMKLFNTNSMETVQACQE